MTDKVGPHSPTQSGEAMNDDGNGRFPWQNRRNLKAAEYTRDFDATRNLPYEDKFGGFLQLCEEAGKETFQIVVVAFPAVLGDDYDELIRNLAQSAKAGLLVAFAGPGD